jgi:hypothetical protein
VFQAVSVRFLPVVFIYKDATVVDYASMAIVPYLKAVCKPSFRVNKRERGIGLASASQVVEPDHPAPAPSESVLERAGVVYRFQGL